MRPKHRRLAWIASGLCLLGLAAFMVFSVFRDNMVFFHSPSALAAAAEPGRRIRIGGLVEAGSLRSEGRIHRFRVTDLAAGIDVVHEGDLPDLFREGQGVVAEGALSAGGRLFHAERVLARHDENYMPREVADALREAGQWQENE